MTTAWVIGIDEAGYGPNLGPLVMSAVACRVPTALVQQDWWATLSSVARRCRDTSPARLLIDDSKAVYSGANGLAHLETGVLATCATTATTDSRTLLDYLQQHGPGVVADLKQEIWFHGTTPIPVAADATDLHAWTEQFHDVSRTLSMHWHAVRSLVLCPTQYNALLENGESKGVVLAHGLTQLMRDCVRHCRDADSIHFFVDKHGGRNSYAALLQDALDEGMVTVQEERAARSSYRFLGVEPEVYVTFQPRADAEHFCVALASMASKFLRELLMGEFNQFWQTKVPGLKPTAGYPQDAVRFFAAIRPLLSELGVREDAIWRKK